MPIITDFNSNKSLLVGDNLTLRCDVIEETKGGMFGIMFLKDDGESEIVEVQVNRQHFAPPETLHISF